MDYFIVGRSFGSYMGSVHEVFKWLYDGSTIYSNGNRLYLKRGISINGT